MSVPPHDLSTTMGEMHEIWAITSYFNPLKWRSRLLNYRFFRRHLPVPLVAVEWHPDGEFQLGADDAEILVQVQGGDLMWQKERLLNIGVANLPAEAEVVAWLDCDIVVLGPGWPQEAMRALSRHEAVQLFSEAHFLGHRQSRALLASPAEALPPEALLPGLGKGKPSSAALVGTDGPRAFDRFHRGYPGMAWAARRPTIAKVGLFDRTIMGSGDFFWLLAAVGLSEGWLAARNHLGHYQYLARSSYLAWARELRALMDSRIGFLDAPLIHLYHGDSENRRYIQRHKAFNREGIDIDSDIALSAHGVWRFVNPKPTWTSLMNRYFQERREDDP